ncbi:ABC transporter permease [Pseudoflavonifractor sp. 524-17]|uniref:ABC transporter permease n=1 Tax=Pseudoflavonifractor sp. 524-17 TaxID=2304577 RepID=UPI00137AC13F|nr:ABC transporter permease [Pseudoflavonifractor sp. 524-17]NCE65420.1 ABC transporter permease [Pseudoflavonifractor sp. 524-17]
MRNYFSAECFKAFRRKYFYIALAVCLAGEGLLLWSYWFTYSRGNVHISFQSTAIELLLMLSFGLYATILLGDVVFSDQYKWGTLKNEVSYGVSRSVIYLGKLLAAGLLSVVACGVMMGFYLAGCWVLFPHGAGDGLFFQMLGYCLAGALPLWISALAVIMACFFNIRSSTVGTLLAVGILMVLSNIIQILGLLVNDVFLKIYEYMPTVIVDNLKNMAFDWSYVGRAWLVGAVWTVGAVAVGLMGFHRSEIR